MSRVVLALAGALAAAGCRQSEPATGGHVATGYVHQVVATAFQSCRLDGDGTVTCWGEEPARGDDGRPHAIERIDHAVQLSAGLSDRCAVLRDRTVACWGIGWSWPDARRPPPRRAFPVPGLADVAQVSAGRGHVCAALGSGEVACWGSNWRGEIGRAPVQRADSAHEPVVVAGIHDAIAVAAGDESTWVLHRDGTVGRFGGRDLPRATAHVLRPVSGLRDVVAIEAGGRFVCALTRRGEVWCAGDNRLGELGAGDRDAHDGAVRVRGLTGIQRIAANGIHACAVDGAGAVWCWGSEYGADIMPPRGDDEDHGPVRIAGVPPAVDVAVGDLHACVALADSSVWCWGSGRNGETGQGRLQAKIPPTRVALPGG